LSDKNPVEAMEFLVERISKAKNNKAFLKSMNT
jgi:transcription termination factor Rho